MAEDKKQSAEEIVDNLAEEMGVKDEKVPDESSEDLAQDLGGIFGVSSKKKKKKKKKDAAPEAETKEPEEKKEEKKDEPKEEEPKDEKSEEKSEPKKDEPAASSDEEKPKKKGKAAIDGVFAPSGGGSSSKSSSSYDDDLYLDEDDLGGASAGGANKAMIGVIAGLLLVIVGGVLFMTPVGNDIILVFKGEYRAQKDARIKQQEEEYDAAQKAALPKYGNLMITGSPKYATIKLNGELQYGKTSSGYHREMTLVPGSSNFQGLSVKEKQVVEVSAPGFESKTIEVTEGMWQGDSGVYSFALTASLLPLDEWQKNEFDARMGGDVENEYFGGITINSNPPGATIKFNNKPLLDEKGNPLVTPVTFDKNWVKDEKGKLEEKPVRVDTIIDQGHKLEVFFEGQDSMPKYATQIERQNWTCTKLGEDEIKKLGKEHTIQQECKYAYNKTVDFNGIKGFIERREKLRKQIEENNEKVRELRKKAMEGKLDPKTAEAISN